MKKKARARRPSQTTCPCGSGKQYAGCCKPLHEGLEFPQHPEDLVRARFVAYALCLPQYLWNTLHSAHDDRKHDQESFVAECSRRLPSLKYKRVHILDREAPDRHGIARVLFAVELHQLNRDLSFVEQADFIQEDGQWRYLMGVSRPLRELTHNTAEMRLDHWECDHHHHH